MGVPTLDVVDVRHVRRIRVLERRRRSARSLSAEAQHDDTFRRQDILRTRRSPANRIREAQKEETTPPVTRHTVSGTGAQRRGASTKRTDLNLVRFGEDQHTRRVLRYAD